MPKESHIENGFEDKFGNKRKIHDFKGKFSQQGKYKFYPSLGFSELKNGMEEWNKHIFNWNIGDNLPRGEIVGPTTATNWRNRIEGEGSDENFNYSILIRDLRPDLVLLEMATENSELIGMALDINRPMSKEKSRFRRPEDDGVWIFEGYWSNTEKPSQKRVLRFDEIPQAYHPNLRTYRFVNGEVRVTQEHSAFAELKSRKLLGFSDKSVSGVFTSEWLTRSVLDLFPHDWIPIEIPDYETKEVFDDLEIKLIQVNGKTLEWVLGVDVPKGKKNPWRDRVENICEQVKKVKKRAND